ncbi:MAG: metal-dependent hydrolase [Dehalococcoidia bacterium]|jgi:L-ascorbate metabolism protein UlaG (beta-lactamase superfamily)|nr:metal-dependent hydrolase [Dehalococcoidia bacterium]
MAGKSIRWLGHATFIINTPGGKTIVTDPWIEGNPSCPISLGDIKQAHLVLVSHDHFDHAVNAVDISKATGAIVAAMPETIGRFQQELGLPQEKVINGMGMNIGGSAAAEGITITMVEAFHSSATAAPAGWIMRLEDGTHIYHAGDTGIFQNMKLLGELYPLDVALLPMGSCFTMDPVQAARATALLAPKNVIPMHYKTFPILEQTADRFVELVKKEAPGTEVVVLEAGTEYSW